MATSTRLATGSLPGRQISLARVATALRTWQGALAATLLLALFLRVYGMALQGWTPDTYEQMASTQRLVGGEFPFSRVYPPGVAVTLAPFFAVMPQTLATMQMVIIGSSLLLIVVTALGVRRATGDATASLLAAIALTISPSFVYFSRDALFDSISAMWVVSAILLVPLVRKQGWMAGLAYGTALAVACSIRATNLALLPAVAIYWVALAEPRGLVDAMQSVRKPFVITAALMFVLVYVLLMYLGGWTGNASRAPLQLQYLANNMSFYYVAEFGFAAIVVILPLTAVGLFEVWHRSRPLFLVSLYMLLLWPLPHALVPFANGRYVLPAAVFVFACAAHAPAGLSRLWKERPLVLATARTLVCASMIALASMYISIDGHMLFTWQDRVVKSDEGGYRELRPVVADLPAGSLLISAGTRGVRSSNEEIEYIDLIDVSLKPDYGPGAVDDVLKSVSDATSRGRSVFYVYTRLEADGGNLGGWGPGYEEYFEAIDETHSVELVQATANTDFRLYRVVPEPSGVSR